jgi:predicted nuclease of predicted toxin-antitoxin system
MKFIANENIPIEIVNNLRKAGYNFIRIDEIKKGLSDIGVIKLAEKENGILITFDKDFEEQEV